MSDEILNATLELREFLFAAVYENPLATAEFQKALGVFSRVITVPRSATTPSGTRRPCATSCER